MMSLMQASATGYAQNISLNAQNMPLEKVLKTIEQQSGYVFFYDSKDLPKAKVSVTISNASIEEAIKASVKDMPLSWEIVKTNIFLKKKEPTFLERVVATLTSIDVSGRVVDAEGKPLPGASVKVKSSGKSVSANAKGEFLLRGVEDGTLLLVSFIGYVSKEVDAAEEMGNVVLELSDSKLDEVQVIAYGTTTRRLSTGNIGTVTAKEIERQPVSNPLLALQGRVPGLVVTQDVGVPGGGVKVRIQGQNSIGSGNDPFYVIDGVPYVSQMLTTTTGAYILGGSAGPAGSGGGNPMNYINPADIESIDVLKDADATAIYGSRAANGAILITTKKGKQGPTKVDINLQNGWGKVTRYMDLMNTKQYLEMRREALRNDGIAVPSSTDYDLNGLWDPNHQTDWQKELIGGTANYNNFNGSISGGNGAVQYLVGGTYHRESTVFPGNFSDSKGAMHFNLTSISSNQKFRMTLSGNFVTDNNLLPSANLSVYATSLAPNAPNLYNEDGTLNWAPDVAGNSSWKNPIAQNALNTYQNKTNNLQGNTTLSYQIISGLELKSSFGYNRLQTDEFQANPLISNPPERQATSLRSSTFSNSNINLWIIEPQLTYKHVFNKSKLETLLGSTVQHQNNNGNNFLAYGQNSDLVLPDIKSAPNIIVNSTVGSTYKYSAVYTRINYNLDDKYILNLTGRRDGSSRFGEENRFHNFGAIGLAWIFTQEDFMKNMPFLSFGKLKGSYGTTGSDQIGDYKFLNLYSPVNFGVPYQGTTALDVNGLPNPYLQWEETRKSQIGIELGFLRDRIIFSGNYTRNRSSNQLLGYSLPFTTGFGTITQNFPATVENSSWEFTLNTNNINHRQSSWTTSVNLTLPKNKLIAFPGIETSSYKNSLIIGQPLNFIKVFHFLGVDPSTGTYQFSDRYGNTTISPDYSNDNVAIINTSPKFYGGIDNSFRYGGVSLSFLFQFVKQIKVAPIFGNDNLPGERVTNQLVSMLSRWRKEGDVSTVQKFNSNSSLVGSFYTALGSDASYMDASYIRLKNVAVSYLVPEKYYKRWGLNSCRINIQGQNLITLTKYKGLDPESGGIILKVLTLGLQVSL
jgi:TonB-linked SusC/RagA family outer membrane protein